jgi:thioredoxin 1
LCLKKKLKMLEHLTKETFLARVFDYETGKEWEYNGERPCLIDFYADWCMPCKIISPILEELAENFKGRLDIYKINTEDETELASVFGIRNIPSILFVPLKGNPRIAVGALPKEVFLQAIREVLGIEK